MRGGGSLEVFLQFRVPKLCSKCMSSLSSKSGNIIQDQKEILNETMQFYKDLYSKWEVKKVDLNALFAFFSVPIPSEFGRSPYIL